VRWATYHGATPWLLLVVLALLCNVVGMIHLIGLRLVSLRKLNLTGEPQLFGLRRAVLNDLLLTELTPHDFAVGYWGQQLNGRAVRRSRVILGVSQFVTGSVFLGVLLLAPPDGGREVWLECISVAAAIVGWQAGVARYEPWSSLPRLTRRVQQQRRLFGTTQRERITSLLASEAAIYIALLAVGLFVLPHVLLVLAGILVGAKLHVLLTHPLGPPAWAVAGELLGMREGWRRAKSAPRLLQRIEWDFHYIFYFHRWGEDEVAAREAPGSAPAPAARAESVPDRYRAPKSPIRADAQTPPEKSEA